MTDDPDPFRPPAGWTAPPVQPAGPPAQAGWGPPAPPGADGSSAPPVQPSQPGWSPPPAQAGWSAPAQPQAGWRPPSQPEAQPQAGWHQPPPGQLAPSPPGHGAAQAGWGPPPTPVEAWNQPAAPSNARAKWTDRSPNQRGTIDFYFKTPKELEGGARTLYLAATLLSLPLIVPAFLLFSMLKGRYRRITINMFIAIWTYGVSVFIAFGLLSSLGAWLGVPGHLVAIPLTVLTCLPLAGRHLLVSMAARG